MNTQLDKAKISALNEHLLREAVAHIRQWTGCDTQLVGDELKFINTTRSDGSLGSCSINLSTGEFNDFAAAGDFKGRGMLQLYALLHDCSEDVAYDFLKQRGTAVGLSRSCANAHDMKQVEKPAHIAVPVFESDHSVALPPDMHPELGVPDMSWAYRLADGAVSFYVHRFNQEDGKKETRPVSYSTVEKRWVWKYPVNPLPLYGGHRLGQSNAVVVVEGEKACDAAQRQFPNLVCITSAKGSNQAFDSDWRGLVGKDVILVPDNDLPGFDYAVAVTALVIVAGAATVSVKDVRQLGWAAGDDLADHEVGVGFLDDAVDYTEVFKPSQLEPAVVRAASLLELGEFDRQRSRLSEILGVGASTFKKLVKQAKRTSEAATMNMRDWADQLVEPNPEPWEGEVDTAQLFSEIKQLAKRHVVMTDEQATTVALWVMYTYVFEILPQSPILLLTSASPRCGKTTLLDLIGGLVSRCMSTANISAAAIFRSIDIAKPTLLIDEADTFLAANHDVSGILNSGHTKRSAFTTRVEKAGDQLMPKRFSTFCPKCVAMIDLPKSPALLDRCILIRLERAVSTERPEPLPYETHEAFCDLRRRLVKWAEPLLEEGLELDLDLIPRGKNARAHGNWSVLATIAQTAGDEVVRQVGIAAAALLDTDSFAEDLTKDLLTALATVFSDQLKAERFAEAIANPVDRLKGNQDLVASSQLVKKLNDLKHMSWADFNAGKGITERGLAKILKPFGISPMQARVNAQQTRGYRVGQFVSVWDRYDVKLPDSNQSSSVQTNIDTERHD